MSREELLELESRREIFATVDEFPGIHLRELKRRLDYSTGNLTYHLRKLVKGGLLERESGEYTRFYPRGEFCKDEKKVLSMLRRKHSRRILVYLVTCPGSSHGDLVEFLDIAPSTVSWHLDKLKEKDLVEVKREGPSNNYFVTEPEKVKRVYVAYQQNFLDRLVDGMVDLWDI